MIKENVIRRNLITTAIDIGNVDPIFEAMNLSGNVVIESPWVEIGEDDAEWKALQFTKLKTAKISEVKEEAAKRILKLYPQYKQSNILGAIAVIHNLEMVALKNGTEYNLTDEEKTAVDKAKICNQYILLIREKSNMIIQIINQATEILEIQSIDISDDQYW